MNSIEKEVVLHCLKTMIDEEVCEECVLYGMAGTDHCEKDCIRLAINELEQRVTPQPKVGYWTQTNEFFISSNGQFVYKFICSECNCVSYFRKKDKKVRGGNICPNCGACMVESEE